MNKLDQIHFRRITIVVSGALALLFSACAVGPDYVRPKLDLPSASNTTSLVSPANWWRVFNDSNIDKLVNEGLANNSNLLAVAARVAEAEAQLNLTHSDQLPSAYLSAGRTRNRNSQKAGNFQTGIPLETTDNKAALNVSWELDFWGKYRRATEAARADLLSIEANRDALRLSIASQITQGYIALVALDTQLATTQAALIRAKEGFEMQKKRFEAGVASEFEYKKTARRRSVEGTEGTTELSNSVQDFPV